jgi:hypothetical protein
MLGVKWMGLLGWGIAEFTWDYLPTALLFLLKSYLRIQKTMQAIVDPNMGPTQ